MAVIIDDIGYNLDMLDKMLSLDADITFSVLPGGPYSLESAKRIKAAGREIMLHLPMEPFAGEMDPGPGALLVSMSRNRLEQTLKEDLNAVPGIMGVNNHMGSRFTADEKDMEIVLRQLKSEGLFFVDSQTTSRSVGYSLARRMGLRTGMNNLFLDHIEDRKSVTGQWDSLVLSAITGGSAVGIGHPLENTFKVLQEEIPKLKSKGIYLVRVSYIVH